MNSEPIDNSVFDFREAMRELMAARISSESAPPSDAETGKCSILKIDSSPPLAPRTKDCTGIPTTPAAGKSAGAQSSLDSSPENSPASATNNERPKRSRPQRREQPQPPSLAELARAGDIDGLMQQLQCGIPDSTSLPHGQHVLQQAEEVACRWDPTRFVDEMFRRTVSHCSYLQLRCQILFRIRSTSRSLF
jgi:hypothetical protein